MTQQRDAESRLNIHSVNLKELDAEPADVKDGDLWNEGGVLKFRTGGVSKTVTVS